MPLTERELSRLQEVIARLTWSGEWRRVVQFFIAEKGKDKPDIDGLEALLIEHLAAHVKKTANQYRPK